jgi:hypothetical protein
MKNTIVLAAALAVFVAGCGKKEETTITTPDGTSVTVSQDDKKTTGTDVSVSTTGGDMSATVGGVTEADLGLPFYTGSTEDSMGASSKSEVNGQNVVVSMRTTKDDPSKVIDFYKEKVKKPIPSVSDAGGMKVGGLAGELENGAKVAIAATKQSADQDTKVVVTITSNK